MTNHVNILSLNWGICSGAASIGAKHVIAAVSEERFSREKNDDSYPRSSLEYCLKKLGNGGVQNLDGVAIASHHQDYFHQLTRPARWTVKNYIEEQHRYWGPLLIEGKSVSYESEMQHLVDRTQYPKDYWSDNSFGNETFAIDRKKITSDYLGIDQNKVVTIDHHRAHAFYAYYSSGLRGRRTLAFVADGMGDGINASIGIFDEQGRYTQVFNTNQCFIARYYRYITLLLGMKPNEHEYKLMGLAPYGKEKHALEALKVFRETLYVDGIDFKWHIKPSDSYFWFRDRLEGQRFDSIAWAIQRWVEELIATWVDNSIQHYGCDSAIFSGGVAMNVKAMGAVAKLPKLKHFFVPGSAADESLAIGAGLCMRDDLTFQGLLGQGHTTLDSMYLGPGYSEDDELKALSFIDLNKYQIKSNYHSKDIVTRLVAGDILGRCCGKMEFGQRALGNRSLLADPAIPNIKEKINATIKSRDFWMPFAPIMLDNYRNEYLVGPHVDSPYMTIGYDTTPQGYAAMIAACHPADKTARAQILTKVKNSKMYSILEEFAAETGRGALLNTSFNVHGEPIVNTPQEAIDVLNRTNLDGLILDRHLIIRKEAVI